METKMRGRVLQQNTSLLHESRPVAMELVIERRRAAQVNKENKRDIDKKL